jgi:hypothetical protein
MLRDFARRLTVLIGCSFENIVQIMLCSTAATGAYSVIPAKTGIQG